MGDNENKNLIYIPKNANYIEILGHRIDGFDSFEAFCEHLNKYVELEETVSRLQAENKFLSNHFLYTEAKRDEMLFSQKVELIKSIELAMATAKTTAYKECIEKVKSFYRENKFAYEAECMCEDLDNILDELVGEDNG